METQILKASSKNIKIAADVLRDGGVISFPTDTVYGLGADAVNSYAVNKIYEIKNRPNDKQIVWLVGKNFNIETIANVNTTAKVLIKKFWPGALTIVLKRKNSDETIGLRMPSNKTALKLLKALRSPIATTSANISGDKSAVSSEGVINQLNGKIPLVLTDDETLSGKESTVVDLTGKELKILRQGQINVLHQ